VHADIDINQIHHSMNLPNIRIMKGGLCHISAILSPIAAEACNNDEAKAAVQEFFSIRQMLQSILSRLYPNDIPKTSPQDILYGHLYLSEISHFAKINQHYQEFFGTQLPPSRSCVAVGKRALPGGRRVMMDCILQRGSGGYLRSSSDVDGDKCDTFLEKALQNKNHSLRRTLHVQSISNWAPVCIGPYSQANVLRSSLVFLAGMIGLVPQRMKLIQPTDSETTSWEVQLYQSWKNAASVLDGLEDGGGRLDDCLGGLIYFSADVLQSLVANDDTNEHKSFPWNKLWSTAQCISNNVLSNNANVLMGSVDGVVGEEPPADADPSLYDEDGVLYGGYEDEETWREISGVEASTSPSSPSPNTSNNVPLLMVCLPELPAKAEAEVELILASRRAASCLDICNSSVISSTVECEKRKSTSQMGILWDTGYDDNNNSSHDCSDASYSSIEMTSVSRLVGLGCACVSTVMAKWKPNSTSTFTDAQDLPDVEKILSSMIDDSINNAKGEGELSSLFTIEDVLNVRLYYKTASVSQRKEVNGNGKVKVDMIDDGSTIRTYLHSVLRMKARKSTNNTTDESTSVPAFTVVPVIGMQLSHESSLAAEETSSTPMLAMQVTITDQVRMESEMWIRNNRTYKYDN